ncbi:MAG: 6-phosphogluconolactonase [Armatimonadota bacterium]
MAATEGRIGRQSVRIADTPADLYHAVAEAIARQAQGARLTLALSGGSTPRALYALLASEYRLRIDWSRVHLFWGDERYVPHDHPASNYRMARETLIEPLGIPDTNVHPMPTDEPDPWRAALRYEEHLREFFGEMPRFDLILLGMGADGHTASLFPGTAALAEWERWVAVGEAPAEPRVRLTLTLPVLNSAKRVYFLVAGKDKAQMVRKVLWENAPLPAGMVKPEAGEVVWWLDREAASLVEW